MTASENKEIVRKLRRAAEGNLPDWAQMPITMPEVRDLLLLVDTITDLRRNEEVRARTIRELRNAQQWVVARDGGRWCERCEQEVARGQAYEEQPGTGGLVVHVLCPDGRAQPRGACPDEWQPYHEAGASPDHCATCGGGQ